jgi:hypothetical protein
MVVVLPSGSTDVMVPVIALVVGASRVVSGSDVVSDSSGDSEVELRSDVLLATNKARYAKLFATNNDGERMKSRRRIVQTHGNNAHNARMNRRGRSETYPLRS